MANGAASQNFDAGGGPPIPPPPPPPVPEEADSVSPGNAPGNNKADPLFFLNKEKLEIFKKNEIVQDITRAIRKRSDPKILNVAQKIESSRHYQKVSSLASQAGLDMVSPTQHASRIIVPEKVGDQTVEAQAEADAEAALEQEVSHTEQVEEYTTEWEDFMSALRRKALAASEIAELLGGPYGDLVAEALKEVAGVAGAGAGAKDSRTGSNLAGKYASRRLVNKKGLSANKANAAGGAVAGALHGYSEGGLKEAGIEAGTTAANWWVLGICFGGLFTLAGSIPCFIYLNLHYFLAKRKKKIFGIQFLPMTFVQKLALLGIDALVALVLMLLIAIPLVMCGKVDGGGSLSAASLAFRAAGYLQGFGAVCDVFGSSSGGASSGAACPPVVENRRWYEFNEAHAQSACYNGPIGTGQWKDKINQYSQSANIDSCALDTIVAKESSGNANAIGHDGGKRGSPDDLDLNASYRYGLNWDHSHGIGLTQLTIFPNGKVGGTWPDPNKPQRQLVGQWYGVTELLNPDTSLDVSARFFASLLKSTGGNLQAAFTKYNGSGSAAEQYGADAMRRYQLCKSQPV